MQLFFNVLIFIIFCLYSIFVGLGLLNLLKLDELENKGLLAPIVALSFWSVILALTVLMGIPVKISAFYIWVISLILSLAGFYKVKQVIEKQSYILFFCMFLSVIVMLAYFWDGRLFTYLAGNMPDGWSYIAIGQHLWENVRGASPKAFVPLYEYAAYFDTSRFISPALLALFSFIFKPGDTQNVMGIFHTWALFVFATSIGYFSLSFFKKKYIALIYCFVVIFSGWTFNLFWVDNLDQFIAIGYLPALAVIFQRKSFKKWTWSVVASLLIAGAIYGYPELSIFVLWSLLILLVAALFQERKFIKQIRKFSLLTAVLTFVFLIPYLGELFPFIIKQFKFTDNTIRPGEGMFAGLLSLQPSAFWGLGSEMGLNHYLLAQNITGALLTITCIIGIVKLVWQKQALVVSWLSTIAAAGYFIIVKQYSYGAYKFVMFSWWGLVCLAFVGIITIRARLKDYKIGLYFFYTIIIACFFASAAFAGIHVVHSAKAPAMGKDIRTNDKLVQLEQVGNIVKQKSVAVVVDDWYSSEWALYYLRNVNIDLIAVRAYMTGYLITKGEHGNIDSVGYLLTDQNSQKIESINPKFRTFFKKVWSNDLYSLWEIRKSDWFLLADIRADVNFFSDIEMNGENASFWFGKDNILRFMSSKTRSINMYGILTPGPGDKNKNRKIKIDDSINYRIESFNKVKPLNLSVNLKEGISDVHIFSIEPDKPTVSIPNDPRLLLVNLAGISITEK